MKIFPRLALDFYKCYWSKLNKKGGFIYQYRADRAVSAEVQVELGTAKWLETKDAFFLFGSTCPQPLFHYPPLSPPTSFPPSLFRLPHLALDNLFCGSASLSFSVNQLSLLLPTLDERWPLPHSLHKVPNRELLGRVFRGEEGCAGRCWKNYPPQSSP